MEIKINKFIYFRNLVNKLKDRGTLEDVRNSVNEKIAAASRRFIKNGKVTPELAPITVKKKGFDTPLLHKGDLVKSIRATNKGVTYNSVGGLHRSGTEKMSSREFIVWYVDENEKRKIIRNVKRDLVKTINEELRRK